MGAAALAEAERHAHGGAMVAHNALDVEGGGAIGASKTVGFVEEGSPVQAAGLQVGDEILAVNGHHCFVMNDVLYELQRTPDQSADLTVKRNGEIVQLDNVGFELVENGDSVTMSIGFKVYALEKNVKTVVSQAFNYTCSMLGWSSVH